MRHLIFALSLFFVSAPLWADAPTLVNYQGKLADASGKPLSGKQQVIFRLYDVAADGTPLWTETQTITPNGNGIFATLLGSVSPLSPLFFSSSERYLAVVVNGQELKPRQRLASVPFALVAGSVDGSAIRDGSITPAKFASNAISVDSATRPAHIPATNAIVWRIDTPENVGDNGTAGSGWWFQPNSALLDPLNENRATSPADYMRNRGIAITMGVQSNLIGKTCTSAPGVTTECFSAVNLAKLIREYGWEIASHSKTHANETQDTLTYDHAIDEIVNSKKEIETAINTADPRLNYKITGFILPGGWKGTAAMACTGDDQTMVGKMFKDNYKWVQHYGAGNSGYWTPNRYIDRPGMYYESAGSQHDSSPGMFRKWLSTCHTPGEVSIFYHHDIINPQVTNPDGSVNISTRIPMAFWKEIVDSLYEEMLYDSGSGWGANARSLGRGRMLLVTMDTAADMEFDTARSGQFWGGIPCGNFNLPDLTLLPNGLRTASASCTLIDDSQMPNDLHGYHQFKHIRYDKVDAGQNGISFGVCNLPKGRYLFKIDARPGSDPNPANNAKRIYCNYNIKDGTAAANTLVPTIELLKTMTPDKWSTFLYIIYVPADGSTLTINLAPYNYNLAMYIGNAQLTRL